MAELGKGVKKTASAAAGKPENEEVILTKFQQMRQEQRATATKIAELEGDLAEHRIVVDALKGVSPDRRCFRMIGGVLVERTVKEVVPALNYNIEQLTVFVGKLKEDLEEKGKEINAFRSQHNIKFQNEAAPDKKDNQSILVSS